MNKRVIAGLLVLGGIGISSLLGPSIKSSADVMNFVSIGVNVTDNQKGEVLNYFNKPADYPKVYKMNYNDETYGKDTDTVSKEEDLTSAYVEKTAEDTGLNIKATNLTKVTAGMLAEVMPTAGVYNGNIVVAAPKGVSGTDAVGAIDSAYSCDIGQTMPKDKEKLANEELKLMLDIEKNQSNNEDNITALFGNTKYDVVEKDIHDRDKITNLITDYSKKYNVNLSNEQKDKLTDFMQVISIQNYYKEGMKSSLTKINNEMNIVLGFSNEKSRKSKGIFSWLFNEKSKAVNIGIIGEINNSASIPSEGVSTASSSDISNAITKSIDFNKEVKEKYKDEPKEVQKTDENKEIKSSVQHKEIIESKENVEKNENKLNKNEVKKATPQKVENKENTEIKESNTQNIEVQGTDRENKIEKSEPKQVENKTKENVDAENTNQGESGTITFDSKTRKVILHADPGSHTEEIEHLDDGQKVQILGQSGHYYKVKTDSGNVGYVYDRYVH